MSLKNDYQYHIEIFELWYLLTMQQIECFYKINLYVYNKNEINMVYLFAVIRNQRRSKTEGVPRWPIHIHAEKR